MKKIKLLVRKVDFLIIRAYENEERALEDYELLKNVSFNSEFDIIDVDFLDQKGF